MICKPAVDLIEFLELEKHPEGGYYRQSYRSNEEIPVEALPERFRGRRAFSTAIYFLLAGDEFSAFHRIQSDEIWHFYAGVTLVLHVIHSDGRYERIRIGSERKQGDVFQAVAPAGCWFGADLTDSEGFALVGCTVAPGFDFEDFELADRAALSVQYPQHRDIIHKLTHS